MQVGGPTPPPSTATERDELAASLARMKEAIARAGGVPASSAAPSAGPGAGAGGAGASRAADADMDDALSMIFEGAQGVQRAVAGGVGADGRGRAGGAGGAGGGFDFAALAALGGAMGGPGQPGAAPGSVGLGAPASEEEGMDMFMKLMSQVARDAGMPGGAGGGAGAGGAGAGGADMGLGDLESFMEKMMDDMLSKDFLYTPVKDVATAFPAWLRANEGKEPADKMADYRKMHGLFEAVAAEFEKPASETSKARVRDLMGDLQAMGPPPQSLLAQLSPDAAQVLMGQQQGGPGAGGPGGLGGMGVLDDDSIKQFQGCSQQ